MSKNAEEAFKKLHHNNGNNNKCSYEPITEDIVDWCVRGDDYREATSLTSPQSPASHQQMRRRRKKKNITAAPSLATVAIITPHTAMPTQIPTPLSTFNHPQNYHPYHPYAINFPSDTDDRKDIQYQKQANYYGNSNSLNLYFLYGDSLARCGQLREAFDIYAFIASNYLDGCIPLSRLKVLSSMLIDYISTASATTAAKTTPQPPAAPTLRRAASSSLAMETNSTIGGGGSGSTATVVLPLHTNVSCDRLQDRLRYSKNKRIQRYWKDGGGGCGDSVGGGGGGGVVGGGGVYGSGGGSVISRISGDVGLCDDDHVRFCDVMLNEDHQEAFSEKQYFATSAMAEEIELDPLLCPICKDILRCPVTANCGHSFCRECCEAATMCVVCRVKFPTSFTAVPVASSEFISSAPMMATLYNSNANTNASQYMGFAAAVDRDNTNTTTHSQLHNNSNSNSNSSSSAPAAALIHNGGGRERGSNGSNDNHNANSNGSNSMKFMPDVLVRRLVEKWWGADLQAKTINERAASFVSLNLLDDALKFCNASLEKCPNNFNSLLLRAEVLRKLNHYQSSLADIDHALRRKSSSAKAHYHRSLALCALGRLDEALVDQFLAISLDDTNFTLSSTELFQHDLAKLLQKLLAQSPKKIHLNSTPTSAAPYDIVLESRQRKKQIGLLNNNFNDTINSEVTTDCDLLRQGSRKHCRRKSYSSAGRRQKQTSQPPATAIQVKFFGSTRFDSILERTQEEVQKIKESESDLSQDQRHLIPVNPNQIDASDFDCVLCCRTFWKPVVTPCGHTYCWVCLDRCMDYKPSCPLCPLCMSPLVEQHVNVLQGSSSPVPFILAKRPVTKFLEAAMKRFIPECYEKRFRQEMDLEPSVPVFICTTAFPHVPCPLFVYEPRYRLMVRRAVESGEKQFGIVQPHSGKSRYFDVGTILDIRDCVLLGDGCSILSTIGCKRFRILARNEKDGYETAKVEYIYDEIITEDNVAFISKMHGSVLSKATEWYESLGTELKEEILRSFGEMPAVEENWESIADGPAWAWWIIALLPLNQQLKVDILTTTSLEKRLRAIEKTLDCMSGTFKRSQQSCVVVPREDIQQCQAVECCQRSSSELSSTSDTHTTSEHSHLML